MTSIERYVIQVEKGKCLTFPTQEEFDNRTDGSYYSLNEMIASYEAMYGKKAEKRWTEVVE